MRHQIRFTKQALQDLRDIWRGCAEFSGLKIADDRHQAIKAKIKLLSQFPQAGRSRDEILVGLRSIAVEPIVIFYRITKTHIEITRVLHGRRDIDAIFNDDADE
jgi:toxin ParE1/3/4